MDNPETKEPGPRIFKSYDAAEGFLPNQERIRMDLREALAVETTNKLFDRYKKLDEVFSRHGFDKKANNLNFSMDIGTILFFSANDKIKLPNGNGTEKIDFLIGVLFDDKRAEAQILEITATSAMEIEVGGKIMKKPFDTMHFHLENGALPDRKQIAGLFESSSFEIKPFQFGVPPNPILSKKEILERDRLKEVKEQFELKFRTSHPFRPGGAKLKM